MSQSPYLSKELKDYFASHQIEIKLNKAVNEMLKQRAEDPFGSLVNLLGNECSQKISLLKIRAFEVFNNEFRPALRFNCSFQYKMSEATGFSQTYVAVDEANPQILYDQDVPDRFEGKGMQKACELVNTKLLELFADVDCNDAKKVEDALKAFSERNQGPCLNITLPVSIIVNKAIASLLQIPLYKRLNSAYFGIENPEPKIPGLFLCILQGSKLHGSKCKPARFYYIIPQDKTGVEKTVIARNLSFGVRKTIASGKLGENGVKQLSDGSFICPFDTINDNLKMLDEVINQNGLKDSVKIGIEWAADNLFQPTAGKYELENPNPKNFLDVNQLADYYAKLCTDRPSLAYLEDPVVSDNYDHWIALKTKLQGKNIKLGSRKLYSSLENAKKALEIVKPEEGGLTEEEAKTANEKKIHLDYAVIRYGDFSTLGTFCQLSSFVLSRSPNVNLVIHDNNSETEDTFIVDLAVSNPRHSLLLGPPLKSERLAKFNRIIEIEQSQ